MGETYAREATVESSRNERRRAKFDRRRDRNAETETDNKDEMGGRKSVMVMVECGDEVDREELSILQKRDELPNEAHALHPMTILSSPASRARTAKLA